MPLLDIVRGNHTGTEAVARMCAVARRLRQLVDDGKLGKNTGEGFCFWGKCRAEKTAKPATASNTGALADRLVLRLVNEAVACLREGIVDDEDLLDAGFVFGSGFAPLRGGPLRYVRFAGIERRHDRVARRDSTQGKRFARDRGWQLLKAP